MAGTEAVAATSGSPATIERNPKRFEFLDSIRALAAWYVVLHHIWLAAFVVFPDNVGPWVVGWLRWGYLAVAIFIGWVGASIELERGAKLMRTALSTDPDADSPTA